MKNMENLNEIFNIDPMKVDPTTGEILAISENISQDKEMDQEDDYQLARQTMRKLLLKSETTLDDLLELSKNSEHPRTYEVAGQFMKTMSDVSKDLLLLQKQVKDLKKDDPVKIGTQNNMVFNGSTSDLFKMLKNGPSSEDNIIDQ
jgi:Terminase DNA packaging enzyme